MKVTAINGSPRKDGNTVTAINIIADMLKKEHIETEMITVGRKNFSGCTACGGCGTLGKCTINDGLNEIVDKMKASDGIIIGSPVYYADISGSLKCFLDRAFFSSGSVFRFKPCAAVVAARRAGTTHALQTINQYFEITEMLITPTAYWSGIHGRGEGEAKNDLEGVQIMKQLGKNMAFLLKLLDGKKDAIPEKDARVFFNYIR